jgi:hypothetical protein
LRRNGLGREAEAADALRDSADMGFEAADVLAAACRID